MPFAPAALPALGLSLLKPILARAGFAVTVHYAGLQFARRIGRTAYDAIAESDAKHLAGDLAFAHVLEPTMSERASNYVTTTVEPRLGAEFAAHLRSAVERAEGFVREVVGELLAERPQIVGFTNTFAQSVASLAAARTLKAQMPDTFVIFGGANCEGLMGSEMARRFPFVDAVVSGEGENVIVDLVQRALSGRSLSDLPGVFARASNASAEAASSASPVAESRAPVALNDLPFPDYDDFCRAISEAGPVRRQTRLLVEASRGCWWGAKHHCTFCGLNGSAMAFRSKSPERFIAELEYLRDRYGVRDVSAVDNILDYKYFQTVLPELARHDLGMRMFFEVKANLTREQVSLLSATGVRSIQPGIESLDDGVLRLMRKGVSALANVQLLKWCKEYGIRPGWNILYGFPGEDPEAYGRMAAIVPLLAHLPPPNVAAPIRIDRFSPYHERPEAFGIENLRPTPAYAAVFDAPPEALANLAYYFAFDYADGRRPWTYARPLVEAVAAWRASHAESELSAIDAESHLFIADTRATAKQAVRILAGVERATYAAADRVQSLRAIATEVRSSEPDASADEIAAACARFVEAGLMLEDGGRYLSLAVRGAGGTQSRGLRSRIDAALGALQPT